MSACPIMLNGVIYPKEKGGAAQPMAVVFVGAGWNPGLEVDNSLPLPTPPDPPIDVPPPIDPPVTPPDSSGFIKPPPADGSAGWAFHSDYGWMWSPGSTGAGPKRR